MIIDDGVAHGLFVATFDVSEVVETEGSVIGLSITGVTSESGEVLGIGTGVISIAGAGEESGVTVGAITNFEFKADVETPDKRLQSAKKLTETIYRIPGIKLSNDPLHCVVNIP